MKGAALRFAAVVLGLCLFSESLPAAVFNCAAGDVDCLISAINTANGNPDADTIILEAGAYTLTAVDNMTDGRNGLPSITGDLTIQGAGADTTIIERDPGGLGFSSQFRIFHASTGADLTLDGLTIRNGFFEAFSGSESGGGLLNRGNLTITRSVIAGNQAAGSGGGISSSGGLAIIDSILSDNSVEAGSCCGAISSSGSLTLTRSLVVGNRCVACSVGGIGNVGTMTISQSTISSNGADVVGGIRNSGVGVITNSTIAGNGGFFGIGGISNHGTLTLTNSTIAGNRGSNSDGQGGGIDNSGSLGIHNCTIADNNADNPAPLGGGGIKNEGGTVELQNTVLARNTETGPFPDKPSDCLGPVTSLGHNLIGDTSRCTITLLGSDKTGDPGLGVFEGAAPGAGHVPLLKTSQAIDAGDSASCTPTDQLGQARVDGDGDGNAVCDIGAIEFTAEKVVVNGLVTLNSTATSFKKDPFGPRGTFTIEARFTNTSSTPIDAPVFAVTQLSTGFLENSDLPRGAVGARLTPDVGDDGVLSPGESFDVEFAIILERKSFTFFVDLLGIPGS